VAKNSDVTTIDGKLTCDWYSQGLKNSAEFRKEYKSRLNVVKASQMPFERSPNGLVQHIIHENMNTKECCMEIHKLFVPAGKASGKSRQLAETVIFVLEGSGYDLHWDVMFDCQDEFTWDWEKEPKKLEWTRGDFIYVPPYTTVQHFSTGKSEAQLIVMTNKILKDMGFDWFEQVENAQGF
jgi:uncharacterized RmlC-like cupin family protein